MSEQHEMQTDFEIMVSAALSRRSLLQGGAALGLFLAGAPALGATASNTRSTLGFTGISASTADEFRVPPGYLAKPLISWGDPLLAGAPEHDESATQPAAAQALQMGDNNDGMSLFVISDNHALLVVNNEYSNLHTLHAHGGAATTADDVLKDHYAHGVSILEIERDAATGFWRYLPGAALNRRITVRTPMQISGPAAGHPLLQTTADPTGRHCLGTYGNCANGKTPWGTYLTCEENTNDYFSASGAFQADAWQQRYGLDASDEYNRHWFRHDSRFDMSLHPNEAHRFGWIVEFDPLDPESVPVKRTAMGRFSHENAAITINHDGHVVVYMGDDARGEHIYRFISAGRYDPNNPAANHNLLDEGSLWVAQFSATDGELKGTGKWLELSHGNNGLDDSAGFPDQAHVLTFARNAATVVGATTMDRPEWIAIHPHNGSVLCTLTNNRNRGVHPDQTVGGPNPRAANHYGQIVRWWPDHNDHRSETFQWDIFVLAGNPVVHAGSSYGGSRNVTPENMFNSPDGLAFDEAGRLWIQTDGNYSNRGDFEGMGNNQMLCADPATGEIRRFATGPLGCELTGVAFSPDQTTMFVGVQHPGEDGTPSHFPTGGNHKPRSTIMMVRREDGGVIGAG
jgi:secreted PhoX family phosphatase